MRKVDPDDVDPAQVGGSHPSRRSLGDPLDLADVALNRYAVPPGEELSGGIHTHLDQEEIFYVLEGTATFEHKSDPTADTETTEVGAGEVVRFAPGDYQHGRNDGDERAVVLAIGAPSDSTEIRVPKACGECGDSDTLAVRKTEPGLRCPECGAVIGRDG